MLNAMNPEQFLLVDDLRAEPTIFAMEIYPSTFAKEIYHFS